MALEACPFCGHLTWVYSDIKRLHYPDCKLATPDNTRPREA